MALLLGVDTGGTYTDAVLVRDEKTVVASAKSLTTRHDLAVGVGMAVASVLAASGIDASDISMASLSTTLATNALVEGQGGRVALIYIGFKEKDLATNGLLDALKGDPCLVLDGGHDHGGSQAMPLDEKVLLAFIETHKSDVSGFAIAGMFATRNPAHEVRAAHLVSEITGKPVSSSHQLSARLNGPKRAVTAVLNARLIGMIDRLITRTEDILNEMGVTAPMMVVRGDGALISAAMARERPIETILSGPAASIVGARWLTGVDHALVSDIGGTTTDVAVLKAGRPEIDPAGARVGPYRTMVEAVAMRTTGLGGDSEVHFVATGLKGGVTLGPCRLLPVSLIAMDAPQAVHSALQSQLRASVPGDHDGRFVRAIQGQTAEGLGQRETTLLGRIGDGVQPLGDVLRNRIESGALNRLIERGLIQIAGATPTDASHVLGQCDVWDSDAAHMALALFGRRRTGAGNMLAPNAEDMARTIIDRLTEQTVLTLLETVFDEEIVDFGIPAEQLARHILLQKGLERHRGLIRLDAAVNLPVIGLGASAPTYYPAVGDRLHCRMILPEHAGVANAIGAVVGRVTIRKCGTVTSPAEGRFRVHLDAGPMDFNDVKTALARLEGELRNLAETQARCAGVGADEVQITVARDIKTAATEARDVFIEATITVEASGRPRIAAG